ncbi:4-oxalocrotonate tautomerase family protein [Rothia sp. SD9660Na]|uniref:tautomerase family protein n=1 Tax=Rothia sp. SD9660Na TaxID=3047030 RepID=UPI0024BBD795|nr:4-oxalocrotonate tautomerase family protein [Rothia sp. SD9660Na]WHS51332.1 4-oxalocrotonate tautomerase family protein [Rothia sp. SD9660Na]
MDAQDEHAPNTPLDLGSSTTQENTMPLINVSYASTQSDEKKAELIAELTRTYARVMGTKESSVWVVLNEVPRTDWGVGGQTLAGLDTAAAQLA